MTTRQHRQSDLHKLAECYGASSTYTDGIGVTRRLTHQALASIMTAMGVGADSPRAIRHELDEARTRPWTQLLDAVTVIPGRTHQASVEIALPLEARHIHQVKLSWVIEDEGKETTEFSCMGKHCQIVQRTFIQGVRYTRLRLPLKRTFAHGYFQLFLRVQWSDHSVEGKTFLIVAPRRCYMPPEPLRGFGVSVQLYNLRTSKNWGIGDFRDLKSLVSWAGKTLGATTVGVSPLHEPADGVISPYSPSSRLFFNPIYLNLETITEFRSTPSIQRQVHSHRFQKMLSKLRDSHLVQYETIRTLKMNVLEKLFQAFQRQHIQRATSRFRAFETYCQSRGIGLRQFATFQVLAEHFGTSVWRQWPTKFHSSESKSVQNFQRKYEKRMRFFQYVQWQCEHQLAGLHRMAHRMNMKLGLYHDLPVGVHPDGADAWMFQDELAAGVTVGAPPDPINLCGQNWGLRAPVPWRMREMGYRFFIETLRRNMQYAGTLRIDHALGLFRLFVIPEGCSGESGMYVKTQVDEILAILALESERHRVMVVGEDLGTVTPEIRKRLTDAGILSYRLMPFEKTVNGKIRSPRQFPKQAVVSFTTHDLPTVRGYWTGRDIEVKTHAGLYPTERHGQAERDERLLGRVALIRALVKERILPKRMLDSMPDQFTLAHIQAIYLYLARTPSRLLIVPLEDLLAEREAPNLPGASSHAYPSWQLRLGQSLEAFRHDSHIHAMAKSINDARLGRSSISTHLKLR